MPTVLAEVAGYEIVDLIQLKLGRNELQEIPEGICRLETLMLIDISHNQIADIHNVEFGAFPNLELLDCSHNRAYSFSCCDIT